MAALTYAEIQTRVANHLRIPTSDATQMIRVQAIINEVYRDLCAKNPTWYWLRKRQVINTATAFEDGTASVTPGVTLVTLTASPSAAFGSFANRVFTVPANAEDPNAVYRVATHVAGEATLLLDAGYTGATGSAAAYHIYQDGYDLATDCNRVFHVKRFGVRHAVTLIGPIEMAGLKEGDTSEGPPSVATVSEFDTSGDPSTARQLVVHPYPDTPYRMEVFYTQSPNTELSGSTRPLIPDDYVQVLIYGALARGFPIFLNDTERGTFYQGLFNDTLNLMVANSRQQEDNPGVAPRNDYRGFYRRGQRITAANADLGSAFDRWPHGT